MLVHSASRDTMAAERFSQAAIENQAAPPFEAAKQHLTAGVGALPIRNRSRRLDGHNTTSATTEAC